MGTNQRSEKIYNFLNPKGIGCVVRSNVIVLFDSKQIARALEELSEAFPKIIFLNITIDSNKWGDKTPAYILLSPMGGWDD
jgi:hypothetical protein